MALKYGLGMCEMDNRDKSGDDLKNGAGSQCNEIL